MQRPDLISYVADHEHREETLRIFRKLYRERHDQSNVGSGPQIPQFYRKQTPKSPLFTTIVDKARRRFLQARDSSLPDDAELDIVFNHLMELSVRSYSGLDPSDWIDFTSFREIHRLCPLRAKPFFTPTVFAIFERDQFGRINSGALYHYIVRKVSADSVRISLMMLDQNDSGWLTESDIERYIYEEIPDMFQLRSVEEGFYPFYVYIASRYIMFFLDPCRKGKVKITDLVTSAIMKELSDLRQPAPEGTISKSWFSAESALRVYSIYLTLDKDQNGMLSKLELAQYNNGALTSLFVERIFQESRTYQGEMDFKSFLELEVALEHKRTPQSLKFFWRILDVDKRGYLNGSDINLFFKSIQRKMVEFGIEPVHNEDIINEIFDMTCTKQHDHLTLDELVKSGVGATVVAILTDINGFWAYDNREALNQEPEPS